MVTEQQSKDILEEIDSSLAGLHARDAEIHTALAIVARILPHYKWLGLYLLDGGVLNLGPYIGAKTEHTLISVGQGVCGTAVAGGCDIVVYDVRDVGNYLSCSVDVRSEIVVLIRAGDNGQIIGLIDADGHEVGAFDSTDEALLREIAGRLAPRLWKIEN